MTVAVLDYGMGNLHSVARAVERVGGEARVTSDPSEVGRADALVVPGVGGFGACMRGLAARGLPEAIRSFAVGGRPVLGVCLGMQVLFERSEEDPDEGLGIIAGGARRLPRGIKVPHMGWNDVAWARVHPYLDGIPSGTKFYFVHSYAADVVPEITVGIAEYGRAFSAVVARDNIFATQFHPERSGDAGLALYEAFVKAASS